jgi:large subunit ribosomal protein L35
MPKMKTHCGMKKRFHVTASGAIKRGKPGNRHLAPGKTQKQKRHLRKFDTVCTSDIKRIHEQLKQMK